MASTSTHLFFVDQTEAAFALYRSVFKTEYAGQLMRMGDVPTPPGGTPLPDADQKLIMHIELPIAGGHILMGADTPVASGMTVRSGNNVSIVVELDTRAEADEVFAGLAADGKVEAAMREEFWGDYFGSLEDKFGINWMILSKSKT